MNKVLVGVATLAPLLAHASPQVLTSDHPSANFGHTSLTVVAVTDPIAHRSWDFSGRLINEVAESFPSASRKLGPHEKRLLLVVKTSSPSAVKYEPGLLLQTASGHSLEYHSQITRSGAGRFTILRWCELIVPSKLRRIDLKGQIASGVRRSIGEARIVNGKVVRSGFDFHPLLSTNQPKDETDTFYIRTPRTKGQEINFDGFDAAGARASLGWYSDTGVLSGDHPKPFGQGKVVRLVMTTRPYVDFTVRGLPLQPSK